MIELFVCLHVQVNYVWPAKSYMATFPTGKKACDRPAVSVSIKNYDGLIERKEKCTCQEREVGAEEKLQASCSSEVSHHLRGQTVIKLSFSEDQSFSGGHSNGELNASGLQMGDEQSLSEVTHPDTSGVMETEGDSVRDASDVASCENITPCSCSEDEIEPLTDEELRLWQYPQGQVWGEEEEEEELRLEGERKDGAAEAETDLESTRAENHKESDQHQDTGAEECLAVGLSMSEVTVSSEAQEEDSPVEDNSELVQLAAFSANQLSDERSGDAGTVAVTQALQVPDRRARSHDTSQPQSERSSPRVGEDLSVSRVPAKPDQQDEAQKEEVVVLQGFAQGDSEVDVQLAGETQPEVQGLSPRSEGDPLKEEQDSVEEQVEESIKLQGGEGSKKVTFVLEPELIGDSAEDMPSSGEGRSF